MHSPTNRNARRGVLYRKWNLEHEKTEGAKQDSRVRRKRSLKEVNMLYDILFVTSFFVTRVVLPIVLTLVVGGWIARRMEPRESSGS
jgi:hypothetical protein